MLGEAAGAASGLERSMAWLVLPHQQLLLIRHHLMLIRCCFAASSVLQVKEALQSEGFYIPLIPDPVALHLCAGEVV